MTEPTCRFCTKPLTRTFADLGMSPLSNSYLSADQLRAMEPFYPLHAYVCSGCRLVQLEQYESPQGIFSEYTYFSSYSDSWLRHAKAYVEMIVGRIGLGPQSQVAEIASNDGYLLQYFVERGIPSYGIEPAANVAQAAVDKGIETHVAFFGVDTATRLAEQGRRTDLLLGNNVLAHVPDINDFVAGMKRLAKPGAIITMEFPHLLQLIRHCQFDTIYHEHFSYLSLWTVERIFSAHGLRVFDVDELTTHGGSLRIYACHDDDKRDDGSALGQVRADESKAGVSQDAIYDQFAGRIAAIKRDLMRFLFSANEEGKVVVGYGAPAKGNTLLNYCGVGPDLLPFTVDRSPHKQGLFLPGTRIPIYAPDEIDRVRPDYVLILPWNLRDEIVQQMSHVRDWGGRFVVTIPELIID